MVANSFRHATSVVGSGRLKSTSVPTTRLLLSHARGSRDFKVLIFGLPNAPSQFARIMELVMSGLTYDVCLDDILVFSKTFNEHLERLATVFDRLDCYLLKLKLSKCSLFQRKVSFLGHVVS